MVLVYLVLHSLPTTTTTTTTTTTSTSATNNRPIFPVNPHQTYKSLTKPVQIVTKGFVSTRFLLAALAQPTV